MRTTLVINPLTLIVNSLIHLPSRSSRCTRAPCSSNPRPNPRPNPNPNPNPNQVEQVYKSFMLIYIEEADDETLASMQLGRDEIDEKVL